MLATPHDVMAFRVPRVMMSSRRSRYRLRSSGTGSLLFGKSYPSHHTELFTRHSPVYPAHGAVVQAGIHRILGQHRLPGRQNPPNAECLHFWYHLKLKRPTSMRRGWISFTYRSHITRCRTGAERWTNHFNITTNSVLPKPA